MWSANPPPWALGAGLLVVVGSACLHHGEMVACPRAANETACWESTRTDARGRVRHVVVERVTPGDRCDRVRVEQTSFDENGTVVERAVDERRCGVVDRRVVDRYDLATGEVVRNVSIDTDHDDRFDSVVVRRLPMSDTDRAYAADAREREYRTMQASDDAPKR